MTAASADDLTIDRLVASPSLSGPQVQGLKLSPDGGRITFLRGKESDQSVLDLWAFDRDAGAARRLVDSATLIDGAERALSEEEKARRERDRTLTGKRGIVSYDWNHDGTMLVFPLDGDVFVLPVGEGETGTPKRLTHSEAFETDIRFSPKGTYVSFIRDGDLYAVAVADGAETRLTRGASETLSHGTAEFIAQEEFARRTGYWWAPDERHIAVTAVDESPVMVKERYELGPDGGVTSIEQRYPQAGTANASVRLGVVALSGGAPRWFEQVFDDGYLARVDWLPGADALTYQALNRDQTRLDLIRRDLSGGTRTLLSETADTWVNVTDDLTFLESGGFVWTSERSGYRHVYRADAEGALTPLTQGDWVVDHVARVDEAAGQVYFVGWMDTPLEQHLYRVPLDGGEVVRISRESGWHAPQVGDGVYVDRFSAPDQPPRISVRELADGSRAGWISRNGLDGDHPYGPYLADHAPSRFGTVAASDGTRLHYRMILPPALAKALDSGEPYDGPRYPVVFNPYGGPHGQEARREWLLDMNQILARRGYIVFILDNRGMWNRGKAFEDAIYKAMGTVEIRDQLTGAAHLQTLPYVNGERIGFWGWSYGGYMTLMALTQGAETFKAGVSVAPVTDWHLYDTGYTERYMGHPERARAAYERGNVLTHLGGYEGGLLLIHGMADDNVFFDHSVVLMHHLQAQGRPFDLMTYPGKKHGIRGEAARAHLFKKMLDHFEETLKRD
ncbi:S9 family peptidase [Yunchengibacter salinarum]|uniref:S9 family peptidase n=1 Tax=Yunchengibacter salinarum TaxID=3133399 RepID=UPI0035B646DE